MGLQALTGLVGLAKQTAKGANVASPVWGVGLTDGKVFNIPIDQDAAPLTLPGGASDRFAPAAFRSGAHPGASFTTRVTPRLIPFLLLAALGSNTTTGAGAPFTHVGSPALDLPYLSLFGNLSGERVKLPDCKVNELTI